MAVVTVYAGARKPIPKGAQDLSWDRLVLELTALANEPTGAPEGTDYEDQKRQMIAWAPHTLRIPYRLAENVEHVSLLVVDVDNDDRPTSPITPETIAALMAGKGIQGLLYESPRSTPALPKFRIVATISEPIPPDACRECRTRFAEMLGLGPRCGVHGAIEAVKLFFAGRLHGTPPRRVWVIPGSPVNVRELPPNSDAWAKSFTQAPVASPHLAEIPPADQGIVAAIGPWQSHTGRKHMLVGALAGLMRRECYSAPQWEATVREWLDGAPATVDVEAALTSWQPTWSKDFETVSGEDELARHVGAEHASIIAAAVRKGAWPERVIAALPKAPTRPALSIVAPDTGDPLGTRHFLSETIEPIPYTIPGLCLAPNLGGKISMIGGLPGAGKGPLEAYICVCAALGLPLFDAMPIPVRQKVLYVDVEGWRLTARRMQRIALGLGRDPRELDDWLDLWDTFTILDDRTYYRLEAHPARFIALDSYTTAMLRYDLDQNKNEYAKGAQALATLPDRTVLPITHARKSSAADKHEAPDLTDISGSGALGALAQTGISVWKPDPTNPARISVACLRAPEAQFASFDVEFRDLPNGGLALVRITSEEKEAEEHRASTIGLEAATNAVLTFLHRRPIPLAKTVIADQATVGCERVGSLAGRALSILEDAKLIRGHYGTVLKYEIVSVQRTPAIVSVGLDGRVTFTDGAWRRVEP